MYEIVRLTAESVDSLRELLRVCWLDTYTGLIPDAAIKTALEVWHSDENISRSISNPNSFYAGYMEEGELRGMVAAGMTDETTLSIRQLYVHPAHQRKGIGWKLMDVALHHFDKARLAVLEVEEENLKGVTFYRKYGFVYRRKTKAKVGDYEIPCLVGELKLSN